MSDTYCALIDVAARPIGVDPDLIEAITLQESGGNPWAYNPEPRYRYLWNVRTRRPFRALTADELASKAPPPDFPCLAGDPDQEWWGQQASWGLMQIMGAVAREHGCDVPYLPQLCEPVLNLSIGCRVVQGLLLWAHGDVALAAGAYNGGKGHPNPLYAAKVLAHYTTLGRAGTVQP